MPWFISYTSEAESALYSVFHGIRLRNPFVYRPDLYHVAWNSSTKMDNENISLVQDFAKIDANNASKVVNLHDMLHKNAIWYWLRLTLQTICKWLFLFFQGKSIARSETIITHFCFCRSFLGLCLRVFDGNSFPKYCIYHNSYDTQGRVNSLNADLVPQKAASYKVLHCLTFTQQFSGSFTGNNLRNYCLIVGHVSGA